MLENYFRKFWEARFEASATLLESSGSLFFLNGFLDALSVASGKLF